MELRGIFSIAVLAMAISLFRFKVLPRIKAKRSGKEGESLVSQTLRGKRGTTLLNDVLFKDGEKYCQIDHILVTDYGVYVIETKNHSGLVVGNEEDVYWQVYYGKKGYKLYNPIKQNNMHIKRLEKVIGKQDISSVIIFSDPKCKISKPISGVYRLEEFNAYYRDIVKSKGTKIDRSAVVKTIKDNDLSRSPYHRYKQVQFAKSVAK